VKFASYLFCLAIALVFIFGCGENAEDQSAIAIKVGEESITLGDVQRGFDDILDEKKSDYRPDSLSFRRYVNFLTNSVILDHVASDSIEWPAKLEQRARSYLESWMVARMKYDLWGYEADIEVDQLRKYAEEYGDTEYHMIDIVFSDQKEAAHQMMAIREGAVFQLIADHWGGPEKGDRGWTTYLEIPESVLLYIQDVAPGEVHGPIEAGDGFHIIKLVETRPIPSPRPFSEIQSILLTHLYRDRGGKRLRKFTADLLRDYKYEPKMAEVIWLSEIFREQAAKIDRSYVPEIEVRDGQNYAKDAPELGVPWDPNTCPIDREDWGRVIYTTTEDSTHAILMLDHLLSKPIIMWPTFENVEDLMGLMRERVLSDLESAEAWARGYDKIPELAWRITKRRRVMRARQLRAKIVKPRTEPSEEEVKAWYYSTVGDEVGSATRKYSMLMTSSEEYAKRAKQILSELPNIDQAFAQVKAFDPDVMKLDSAGQVVKGNTATNPIEEEIINLESGDVTEPRKIGNRWAVGIVKSVQRLKVKPWSEVGEAAKTELWASRIDSLMKSYLDERRAITEVVLNEDVLSQVKYGVQTDQ